MVGIVNFSAGAGTLPLNYKYSLFEFFRKPHKSKSQASLFVLKSRTFIMSLLK